MGLLGKTCLAVVEDVHAVEVVDVEIFGYVCGEVVEIAFDARLDGVQQRGVGLGGIERWPAKHGCIKLEHI